MPIFKEGDPNALVSEISLTKEGNLFIRCKKEEQLAFVKDYLNTYLIITPLDGGKVVDFKVKQADKVTLLVTGDFEAVITALKQVRFITPETQKAIFEDSTFQTLTIKKHSAENNASAYLKKLQSFINTQLLENLPEQELAVFKKRAIQYIQSLPSNALKAEPSKWRCTIL